MIFGVIARNTESAVESRLFEAARSAVRMPDTGESVAVDSVMAMAYASPFHTAPYKSLRPVLSADGSVAVVFAGAIYNSSEMAKRAGLGANSEATSNTAALVEQLYRRDGLDFLNQLNGKFALAIWDKRSGAVHLARDRFGIEPLYHYIDDNKVIFGSMVSPIVQYAGAGLDLDLSSVSRFLLFNYNPGIGTFHRQVRKLRPAHVLTIDAKAEKLRPYWRLSFARVRQDTEQGWADALFEQLQSAVERRLDVAAPPGVFVSGGMDSSSILGLASRAAGESLNTFSYRCRGESFDESHYARVMAESTRSKHHEVEYSAEDVLSMPEIVEHMDEPFCDIGINIATCLLGKEAGSAVNCVLTGDGGDELFGGHPIYEADKIAQFVDPVPAFMKKPFFALGRMLPDSDKKKNLAIKIKRFSESLAYPPALLSHRWRIYYTLQELGQLLNPEVYQDVRTHDPYEEILQYNTEADGNDLLSRCLYSDYNTVVDFYLRRNDLNRMYGLETRYPMLDHNLVEFCASMPSAMKIRGWFDTKYIFKKSMERILPNEIVYRKDKLGHSIPLKNWIRDHAGVREFVLDHLSGDTLKKRGIFQPDYVSGLIDDHMNKRRNNSHRLWTLAVLEMWMRKHDVS